jgi:hypothetical protein
MALNNLPDELLSYLAKLVKNREDISSVCNFCALSKQCHCLLSPQKELWNGKDRQVVADILWLKKYPFMFLMYLNRSGMPVLEGVASFF